MAKRTATLVRKLDDPGFHGDARLYRADPPMDKDEDGEPVDACDHV